MEHRANRKMLGTDIEISVISDDGHIDRRMNGLFDYISSFEQEFSRFLPHSNLSILNEYGKSEVSERFLDLVKISIDLHKRTNSYFNPLTDISAIGYSHDFESKNFEKIERKIDLDISKIKISGKTIFLEEGQKLDFGGIGKGYAVDNCGKFLKMFGYDNFFINAGGDIVASGKNNEGGNWVIGIENPFDGSLLGQIDLINMSIATSGNYKRKWEIDGTQYHHLINPKTGGNNFEVISVSVLANTGAEADAFTKALFNMDIRTSLEFIEKNNLSGFIVTSNNEILTTKGIEGKYNFKLY